MKGYWINNNGGQASASPVSLLETPSIGIAPLLTPTGYSNSLTAICNYWLDPSTLSFSSKAFCSLPEGVPGRWQYEIADFTPNNVLPNSPWYGFTTTVEPVTDTQGIKYEWKAEQENPVSMARVYQMKCKILRISPYVLNPYSLTDKQSYINLLDIIDKIYDYNFTDNTKYNLPTWTGQLAPAGEGGGATGVATMKQNRHYAATGVSSPGKKYIYENGIFLPHMITRDHNDEYRPYNVYPADVTVSPISHLRTSVIYDSNYPNPTEDGDLVNQTINRVYYKGLPFLFNNTITGMGMYTSSTQFEFANLPFNLNNAWAPAGSELNQSLAMLYGYRMEKSVTPLPHVASNQVVHFGDGKGVLDSTLLSKYNFRDIVYTNNPSRYCYITYNQQKRLMNVYFIITYLTNDIITITKHNRTDYIYGHIKLNNLMEV